MSRERSERMYDLLTGKIIGPRIKKRERERERERERRLDILNPSKVKRKFFMAKICQDLLN